MINRDIILIVDDVEINRDMLGDIFEDSYEVHKSPDGTDAIEFIKANYKRIAAVLLDLYMPGISGLDVLDEIQKGGYINEFPTLMITTEDSFGSEKKCFEKGASDFIRKPFDESIVKKRVENVFSLYWYKSELEEKVASQNEKIRKNTFNIISILSNVVESRSLESGEHVERVKKYTNAMAIAAMQKFPKYALSESKVLLITEASALHDIGKIAIPDGILHKPGRLTDEEFRIMKEHTTRGCDFLKQMSSYWDDEYGKASYEICRHHHERVDGRGYPDGLKGDEIPIAAQLVSIADVYDALTHERCYKAAYSTQEAFNMICAGECGSFSEEMIECFKASKEAFENITNMR